MELHGENLIGFATSSEGSALVRGVSPTNGETLEPGFHEATEGEVDRAARSAARAFSAFSASLRSDFLRRIAANIHALGDELIERASDETGLPTVRLQGERGRTVAQIEMFAALIDEGSWVDARIDRAMPDRQPLPRPDIRRMLVPLGPVAVFGASNFPLAFSVAGGDTISALAAGCAVVVKAHPAHPGTSELVGRAIVEAARETGMPEGVFSMVHGASHATGLALVTHPAICAVGFTGSLGGGRALFDAACRRPQPIPVYAEMGSSNPVFVLPGALATRGAEIAKGLAASVMLGAGQFCTNPGVTVVDRSDAAEVLLSAVGDAIAAGNAGTMVTAGIKSAYATGVTAAENVDGVAVVARSASTDSPAAPEAALLVTDAATYSNSDVLQRELYGPATVAVRCGSRDEMLELARSMHGHLTATVHGTDEDLADNADLLAILAGKVGRVVVNGFPTGVEVCPAMHHGGPYPATTDSRATSVGTAAILRFARPVCFQGFPDGALPEELRDANPRGIWRLVDGELTREAL